MPHERPHPPIQYPALRDAVVRCEEENCREWSLSLNSGQAFGTETCGLERDIITHPGNTGQLPEWLRSIDSGGMNMARRPVTRYSIAYLLISCMEVLNMRLPTWQRAASENSALQQMGVTDPVLWNELSGTSADLRRCRYKCQQQHGEPTRTLRMGNPV